MGFTQRKVEEILLKINSSDRKKLLILRGGSQYVSPERYNVQEIGLAKILAKLGWEILIISSGPENRTININNNIEWVELKRFGKTFGWPMGSLSLIKRFNPDLIQQQDISNPTSFIALVAKLKLNVPLVLSLGEYKYKGKLKSLFTNFASFCLRGAVSSVLCKTYSSMEFSKKLGFENNFYTPIGIDESAYSKKENLSFNWVSELKIRREKGQRILCHIGRLDKHDNSEFLCNLMKNLPEHFSLLLIGEPVNHVKKFIDEKIANRIILTGSVPNKYVGKALENSDLYIACSKYEIFGMSAVESIYHGCPVVGFSTGGIKEIINDGENGWKLNTRETMGWVNLILDIFEKEDVDKLKIKCKSLKNLYTWGHRAIAYNEVYKEQLKS